jgi:hypothetical protein
MVLLAPGERLLTVCSVGVIWSLLFVDCAVILADPVVVAWLVRVTLIRWLLVRSAFFEPVVSQTALTLVSVIMGLSTNVSASSVGILMLTCGVPYALHGI